MQVTQIKNGQVMTTDIPKPTGEEMQQEYDYILAEQMTNALLAKGLITEDEHGKIMAKNRASFSPLISKIMQK